ncbi:MAG TPA: PilZ domain-containing protein [Solirubrobacteraceae bacterium]|nr:PilZ domain-containing protein [Solirubrobacteraceae bacterium]
MKNQPVRIDLDARVDWEADCIQCRVEAVQGPVATLIPQDEIPPDVLERLRTGSLCFMTFTHGGAPVALRGVTLAREGVERLEFVVVDGIQVAERRGAERTPLVTAVRASAIGPDGTPGEPVATVTSNLSIGGALLLKRPKLGLGPRWKVELFLPGDPDHVHCEAVLARETPTHLGVRLVGMEDADKVRVASLLASIQRRSAPLAA